jgi:ADP-ribosylglycohydrolase
MVKAVAKKVDEKRLAAAIKGALLADAASMGTHMIMDPEEVKKEVPSEEAPEFKDPPTPRGYSAEEFPGHYGPGMLSPWGEQLLFATDYCGRHKCVTAGHMSVRMKEWAETFGGLQDESIKEFLHCMKQVDRSVELCGAEDERAHCYAKIIPVVCLYAGEIDMLERVNEAILVHQTNPKAKRFGMAAASVLESILLGMSLKEALEKVVEAAMSSSSNFSLDDTDIGDACLYSLMEAKSKDLSQLMEGLVEEEEEQGGRTSRFPSAFIVPMYLFYQAMADGKVDDASYTKAVRANILAGGDTCARAILIGAIMAAAAGSVPDSFVEKFPKETMEKVDKAIAGIIESIN